MLCTQARYFINLKKSIFSTCDIAMIILQIKKPKLWEVKQIVQDYTASKKQI